MNIRLRFIREHNRLYKNILKLLWHLQGRDGARVYMFHSVLNDKADVYSKFAISTASFEKFLEFELSRGQKPMDEADLKNAVDNPRGFNNHFAVSFDDIYDLAQGWQTGFANKENLLGTHDKNIWCFIGQIKGYRIPMFNAFKNVELGFSSVSEKWNSHQLTDDEVKQIYLDSAFSLVPFGSIHADTMRIMETLEYGCIPVVIKYLRGEYYKLLLSDKT